MRLVNPIFAGMSANAYGVADVTQQFPLGTRAFGIEQDPSTTANVLNGGGGEFVYCQINGTIAVGTPVTMDSLTWTIAALANTANLGTAVGIAATAFSATNNFGWVQLSGQAPVVNNGTFAAASSCYIQAAGVLFTTLTAGKQVCGMRSIIAAAATFARNGTTKINSKQLRVSDCTGIFAGLAVSGTGIAASVVTDVDPGGNIVTLSVAMTASSQSFATAVTFTYTNLGGVMMNHPFAQGNIT